MPAAQVSAPRMSNRLESDRKSPKARSQKETQGPQSKRGRAQDDVGQSNAKRPNTEATPPKELARPSPEDQGDSPAEPSVINRDDKQVLKNNPPPIGKMRIFTLNVWGLRTHGKLEDLKAFLNDLSVHVGVITETHLLREEAKAKTIPGYTVVEADGKYTHKGGALIIVSHKISHRPVPEALVRRKQEISACSCLIYPHHRYDVAVRLTGIYIPPSADATGAMVEYLTKPSSQIKSSGGGVMNHLLVGDCNQNTWEK